MSKLQVSVLIIAQNAQAFLPRCLDSLRDFAEVVIIDGGSTDNTLQICKEYPNVVVHHNPWPGFIAQRNFSLTKASHDWCLMLDSDERVTPELVSEIQKTITNPGEAVMYRVVRTEYFEGHAIESGFGASNYQERLFLRSRVVYGGGVHHIHLIDGKQEFPGSPLMADLPRHARIEHWPDFSMDDWLRKLPRFISLIAHEKMRQGRSVSTLDVLATMFGTFFQIMWKSKGEGRLGFVLAIQETIYRLGVKIYIYNYQKLAAKKQTNFEKKYLG